MTVDDLQVKDCQFHISHTYPGWSDSPIAMLPPNNNTVDIDPRSYPECRGKGRPTTLRFIVGGDVVFRGEMIVSASGSSQLIGTELSQLILPKLAELPDAIGSNFYNASQGYLAIPFAWVRLELDLRLEFETGGSDVISVVKLLKNDVVVHQGEYPGKSAHDSWSLLSLRRGDCIRVNVSSTTPRKLVDGPDTRLTVSAWS